MTRRSTQQNPQGWSAVAVTVVVSLVRDREPPMRFPAIAELVTVGSRPGAVSTAPSADRWSSNIPTPLTVVRYLW
jgi:hypothetical protein